MNKPVRPSALLFLLLLSAPAAAQPGADDAPPPPPDVLILEPAPAPPPAYPPPLPAQPAPHNEHWNNVSHINGQVVPVGERGNYLHKWKKTNVASNPIGWMLGFYGVSVSHAIHNNVALRGDANLFHQIRDTNTKGYELGASAAIYFKRVYQGPFMEPGLIVREFQNDFCDFDCSNNKSVGPSVVFGWHWTFDSGLNVAAAFGVMRNINAQMNEFGGNNDIEPSGYFRVGYAF